MSVVLRLAALLAKIPGKAWIVALLVAVLAAGGYAMYAKGHAAGVHETKVATVARATRVAVLKRDTATAHANAAVHAATIAEAVAEDGRHVVDSTRAQRVAARSAALGELLDTGLPRTHALIAADDTLIRRDSVVIAQLHSTIVRKDAAIDSLLVERASRELVDSLRVETIAIGAPEPDHHTVAKIAGGVVVGVVALLTLLHLAR